MLKGGSVMSAGVISLSDFIEGLGGELDELVERIEEAGTGSKVCQLLRDEHDIQCYWEYPGYIDVPLGPEGDPCMCIGDINPTWTMNVTNQEGDTFECHDFEIPSDHGDAKFIASTIATFIKSFRHFAGPGCFKTYKPVPSRAHVAELLAKMAFALKKAKDAYPNCSEEAEEDMVACYDRALELGYQGLSEGSDFSDWALKATQEEIIEEAIRRVGVWARVVCKGGAI
jgi:hypothetical protein